MRKEAEEEEEEEGRVGTDDMPVLLSESGASPPPPPPVPPVQPPPPPFSSSWTAPIQKKQSDVGSSSTSTTAVAATRTLSSSSRPHTAPSSLSSTSLVSDKAVSNQVHFSSNSSTSSQGSNKSSGSSRSSKSSSSKGSSSSSSTTTTTGKRVAPSTLASTSSSSSSASSSSSSSLAVAKRERDKTLTLKREVIGMKADFKELILVLAKTSAEAATRKKALDEVTAYVRALEEELERHALQEQALTLKMSTNEQAFALAREELNSNLAQREEEHERERTLLVKTLSERGAAVEASEKLCLEKERELQNARVHIGQMQIHLDGVLVQAATVNKEKRALEVEVKEWKARCEKAKEKAVVPRAPTPPPSLPPPPPVEALLPPPRRTASSTTNPFEDNDDEEEEEEEEESVAAKARIHELELRLEEQQRQMEELQAYVKVVREELVTEKEYSAGLVSERNSLRHKSDSLKREIGRVTPRLASLSASLSLSQIGEGEVEAGGQELQSMGDMEALIREYHELKAIVDKRLQAEAAAVASSHDGNSSSSKQKTTHRATSLSLSNSLPQSVMNGMMGRRLSHSGRDVFGLGAATAPPLPPLPPHLRRRARSTGSERGGPSPPPLPSPTTVHKSAVELHRLVQGLTESLQDKQEQLEVQKDLAKRLAGKLHKLEDRIREEGGMEALPMDWDVRAVETKKEEGEP